MKTIIAFLAAVALSATARADDNEWTQADTAYEVAFAGVVLVDVMQTRSNLDDGGTELNPLIGTYPPRARLFGMAAAGVVAHAAIAWILPRPYRRHWQVMWIGIETGVVATNTMVMSGFRLSF